MSSAVSSGGSSGQMINIRRDVKDPFYRYKMPKLVSKIEGRGNGIKTVINNASDIGRALSRPPSYLTKYFAFELGTLCIINDRDNRYIVNGAHDSEKLQGILDGFISKFVLCQSCENPETELQINKDGTVSRACKACGNRGPVDMAHRLVSYIEKNPPPSKRAKKATPSQAEPGHDMASATVKAPSELLDSAIVEGITLTDKFKTEAEEATASADQKVMSREKRRLQAYYSKLDALAKFLRDSDPLNVPNESIMDYIKEHTLAYEDGLIVCVQVLFADESTSFTGVFKSRLPLLAELIKGEREQRVFLGTLERLIAVKRPSLMKQVPAIFQMIYNQDLIEEHVFLLWNEKPSNRFIRIALAKELRQIAKPFIEWLHEEEDERTEEDEDEEDVTHGSETE